MHFPRWFDLTRRFLLSTRTAPHRRPPVRLRRQQRAPWQANLSVSAEVLEVRTLLSGLQPPTVTITTPTSITETNSAFDGDNIIINGTTVAIDGAHSFNSIQV